MYLRAINRKNYVKNLNHLRANTLYAISNIMPTLYANDINPFFLGKKNDINMCFEVILNSEAFILVSH